MIPEAGKIYRHIKGGVYKVIAIATQTETEERLVIYTDANRNVWARPYDMFTDGRFSENGRFSEKGEQT